MRVWRVLEGVDASAGRLLGALLQKHDACSPVYNILVGPKEGGGVGGGSVLENLRDDTHIPLIFFGWNTPHKWDNQTHYITDIAATITAMLNIQQPNACVGNAIEF